MDLNFKATNEGTHVIADDVLIVGIGDSAQAKLTNIVHMAVPQNKVQLQSFIGLCNYLTCYVPHLTNVLAPLHTLTVKTNEFKWSKHIQMHLKQRREL